MMKILSIGLATTNGLMVRRSEDQYDMDQYAYYEASGADWSLTGALKNILTGKEEDYEGSSQVVNWWDTIADENYDLDKASDILTRYPVAIDDSDPTLEHLISVFAIGITAIMLALVACSAYGRVRKLKEKKQRDKRPSSEETRSLL